MRALKILMIAPTPYFSDRGCHVRIYEEARALKNCGHEVVIVTYHLGRDVGDIPVVRIPNFPWYRKLSAGPSWHKPYLDIFLLYKALVTAKKFSPDIVHAHLHEGAFLAAIARRSFKVPLLFDCQGSLTGELLDHGFMRKDGLLHRFFARLEDWIVQQVSHIVTSSTPTAESLERSDLDVAGRLTPLPDAVDTDFFRPMGKDLALLEKLGVPKGKTVVLYLGAMSDYQGVDLLLESVAELSRHRSDFHVLLMGYPEDVYAARAVRLGISHVTTFTGKLDYALAPQYLSLGDIAVSPKLSVTEANGKLLNYLACGLPSVVFDSPVNRELLGNLGCYAKLGDGDHFTRVIAALLDDPERVVELSKKSRQHAVENHSWAARISVLNDIYTALKR